jgi:hypothetical protein
MKEGNSSDVSNSFWGLQKVVYYCNIPSYKHPHKLILSISAQKLTIPHPAYSLILPTK